MRRPARRARTPLICTEKDIFNLSGVQWGGIDLYYCRISLHVAYEDEFWRTVLAAAESRGQRTK